MVSLNKHCCHCRARVIVAGRTEHTGALWVLSSRSRCGNACRDAKKRVVPLSSTPRLLKSGWRALGVVGSPASPLGEAGGGHTPIAYHIRGVTVAGLSPPWHLADGARLWWVCYRQGLSLRADRGVRARGPRKGRWGHTCRLPSESLAVG